MHKGIILSGMIKNKIIFLSSKHTEMLHIENNQMQLCFSLIYWMSIHFSMQILMQLMAYHMRMLTFFN